jgi:hypothetical protein
MNDVYVVFADDNIYNKFEDDDKVCEKIHLYGIFEKEKDAIKTVKKLNRKLSMYKDAFYEAWVIQ